MHSSTQASTRISLAAAGFGAQSAMAMAHSSRRAGRDQGHPGRPAHAPPAGRARAARPEGPPAHSRTASTGSPRVASRRPAAGPGATTIPRQFAQEPARARRFGSRHPRDSFRGGATASPQRARPSSRRRSDGQPETAAVAKGMIDALDRQATIRAEACRERELERARTDFSDAVSPHREMLVRSRPAEPRSRCSRRARPRRRRAARRRTRVRRLVAASPRRVLLDRPRVERLGRGP